MLISRGLVAVATAVLGAACGDGAGGGGKLAGVYLPYFGDVPADSRGLAAATADRQWEFSEDGVVVTHSQRGAQRWSYEIRGSEIRLQGLGPSNQGERRRFTFAQDKRCIWDGRGNPPIDTRFCPKEP
jgi:hypothetical protein